MAPNVTLDYLSVALTTTTNPAMKRASDTTRRRFLGSTLAAAAGAASLALPAASRPVDAADGAGAANDRWLPVDRIGLQVYTMRDLTEDDRLGLEDTLAVMRDVGVARLELPGAFYGRDPADLRELVQRYGMRISGNHFGPRSMDGENRWYSESGRRQIFAEARDLGLEYVGTGHYYNVPLTVDGFRSFAQNLTAWGAHAADAGMKFYFHNHDGEFTRFDGRPIFDILLEETDPEYVSFELDVGWVGIAGEDVYELVREHQHRIPLFHVKDFRFDDEGPRETKPNTVAGGRRFSFADVGKGQVDWPRLFSVLDDPSAHIFFIERDDAGSSCPAEDGTPPTNPAGSANTVWSSYTYLRRLTF